MLVNVERDSEFGNIGSQKLKALRTGSDKCAIFAICHERPEGLIVESIAKTSTNSSTPSGRIATVQRGFTIGVEHDLNLAF